MAIRSFKISSNRITEKSTESLKVYFNEVKKFKILDSKEEFDLTERIQGGDQKALAQLVNSNLRFVISVAKQFQNQGIPLEDLINDGNLGLLRAAEKFDNTKGFKFISYAIWWIRQSILQAISDTARTVRIPNNQNAYIKKVNKTICKLQQTLGREPTTEEIALAIEETDIKIKDIMNLSTKTISLDSPVYEGENLYYIDFIPNASAKMPDMHFQTESLHKDVEQTLNNLEWKQKMIVCMNFGLCGYMSMTLEEIGDYMDLTRERVRQIKESAIQRLRTRRNSMLLRAYNGEELY